MACWEYLGVAKIAIFLRFFGFSRRFFSFGWWRLLDRNVLRELLCKGVSPLACGRSGPSFVSDFLRPFDSGSSGLYF